MYLSRRQMAALITAASLVGQLITFGGAQAWTYFREDPMSIMLRRMTVICISLAIHVGRNPLTCVDETGLLKDRGE